MCELLTVMDPKIVQVALTGLENILQLGQQEAKSRGGTNPYAIVIEECYGQFFSHGSSFFLMGFQIVNEIC